LTKPLKEFVQQVLAEHDRGEKIRQALEHANATVSALAASPTWRRKGTRRAMFWEFAVSKLIELTLDDPGLFVDEHHDTVSFIFDDAVLIRLKKADIGLHSSNYPTQLALMFHEHQADLFGFTGLQRVEAVYIPNRFDTDIIWTGVVAHEGEVKLWHFELTAPAMAPVVPLPFPTPAPAPTSDLATLKNQAQDNDQKKKGGNEV
jgi:hypothetical protein